MSNCVPSGTSNSSPALVLDVLPVRLAVCRLPADAQVPVWAQQGRGFVSITRTEEELSIVCAAEGVPAGFRQEGPFRALKVRGPLDFSLTGIMARLTRPLADATIAVFVLSTFDTDYLLVRESSLRAAAAALRQAGIAVHGCVAGE